jgi:hypothetical protein
MVWLEKSEVLTIGPPNDCLRVQVVGSRIARGEFMLYLVKGGNPKI